MSISIAEEMLNIANKFRATSTEYQHGVVLIFEGKAIGWTETLHNPKNEKLGTIAVDFSNTIYMVIMDSNTSGKKTWIECDEISDYDIPW